MSCCGRGGSWFGNCGSAGNTKLGHTWYEGLHSCKARAQSNVVIDQQLNKAQQQSIGASNVDSDVNSTTGITIAKPLAFSLAPMSVPPQIIVPISSTAYTTSTINSNPTTAVLGEIVSTAAHQSNATPSITSDKTPNTTQTRIHTSVNIFTTTRLHTEVTSQAYKQVFDMTVHISISLAAALFKC